MAERQVTRKIVKEKDYRVLSLEDGKLIDKGIITRKGRISEKELEKELGIEKVVLQEIKAVYATYAMSVDEFMKYAKLVNEEVKESK